MTFTYLTVTIGAGLRDPGGAQMPAKVRFTPTAPDGMRNGVHTVGAVECTVAADGTLAPAVAATDDPGTLPTGVAYRIEVLPRKAAPRAFYAALPAASPGGTVDLDDLAALGEAPSLSALAETTAGAAAKIAAHAVATDPHGDRAYAAALTSALDVRSGTLSVSDAQVGTFSTLVRNTSGVFVPQATGSSHLHNMRADLFARIGRALGRVRAGTADAKILAVGDSTTAGAKDSTNLTVPARFAYPARLVELLAADGLPAVHGLATPTGTSSAIGGDTRWTAGAGWTMNGSTLQYIGFGGKGAYYRGVGATAGTLTYADDRITADRFDIYYRLAPGSGSTGSFTATATGGAPVTVDAAAGGGSIRVGVATVSAAAAATTNTLTLTGVTAAKNVDIVAVEPWLSTSSKIRVGNAGISGSTTVDWVTYFSGTSTNAYGGVDSIKAYAPDLTIIALGINDANALAADAATFLGRLQTIIAAAQVSGDVLLLSMIPSQSSPVAALETQYVAAMRTLDLPLADQYTRVGSYATYYAAGMMNVDGIHGTDAGYLDIATFLSVGLKAQSGDVPAVVDTAVAAATTALGIAPNVASGTYFHTSSPGTSTTSSTLGVGNLRLVPWRVTTAVTIDRLAISVTGAGDAGARVRLGVYADSGSLTPGALLVDAGQVNADAIGMVEATITSLTLTPGIYWVGGAIQGASTQPTLTINSNWHPPVPIPMGTSLAAANATAAIGYAASSITGALPSPFTGGSSSGNAPRVLARVA